MIVLDGVKSQTVFKGWFSDLKYETDAEVLLNKHPL